MFGQFFEKRKYRAIAFGEVQVIWRDESFTIFSVIFFENDNGKRKWTVSGSRMHRARFYKTSHYAPCETWKHTGLFPTWAKDPVAEKLCRDYTPGE